jgi:sugar/nucleoside kinase (ribokinase family)
MSRVALIGNVTVDRIAGSEPCAGGGVYHAARAAALIGADVVAVTRCAPADRAVALAPLEALGVPVEARDADETTAFSFHYEGDHRVMTVDAVGEPWTVEDVTGWAAPALAGSRWVLVAGLLRSHFPAATVAALAEGGRRLLLDAQGLARVARVGPLVRDDRIDRAVLHRLAVLKLNEDEARTLAGGLDADSLLALGVPEVVVTLGSDGARVVTPDLDVPIRPRRVEARNPTGAGDAFSLVYLDGRAQGLGPVEAADRASAEVASLLAGA